MSSKHVFVSIMLGEENHLVGRLWCHRNKGRESASFEYNESWLKHEEHFALEPVLQLTQGSFHTKANQILFGAIGDSTPDRWGRVLMRRAETQQAKENNKTARTLGEIDYLLGVNDEARQGALRFSEEIGGPYLTLKNGITIPPLVDLPRLLSATEYFIDGDETAEDLRLLLAPGSSLGGARPKASVIDKDGSLAIAKFPRKDDEFNVVIWEAVTLTLAKQSGIHVPDWRLETILDKPVLIMKRFDRDGSIRIPFLSAMSMLDAKDNEQRSYLEIAYALVQSGGDPNTDMSELWSRIVFSILISNTDDHLRNHGFIYERSTRGWRLSPAYDMNPTPAEIKPRILSTAIDFQDSTASLDIALSVIDTFRLSKVQAHGIISEVYVAVAQWRIVAKGFGLSKQEIDRMASAFEHEDLEKARKIAEK